MNSLPQLITFDGEARSGKGTIVQATKDYLRDELGHTVMLIDAGQVFRVLVVAAQRSGVNVDEPESIDRYLNNPVEADAAVRLVKDVYHMMKDERDALLYTSDVSANSAKIGARPEAQRFKDSLLRKWLRDAREEGYDVVLLDGRALEEVGKQLEDEGLCRFVLGLYFVSDPQVGARRTLGLAGMSYGELSDEHKRAVDELTDQIKIRNQQDRERAVQPIRPPHGAISWNLADPTPPLPDHPRPMFVIDTTAELDKQAMTQPVVAMVANVVGKLK